MQYMIVFFATSAVAVTGMKYHSLPPTPHTHICNHKHKQTHKHKQAKTHTHPTLCSLLCANNCKKLLAGAPAYTETTTRQNTTSVYQHWVWEHRTSGKHPFRNPPPILDSLFDHAQVSGTTRFAFYRTIEKPYKENFKVSDANRGASQHPADSVLGREFYRIEEALHCWELKGPHRRPPKMWFPLVSLTPEWPSWQVSLFYTATYDLLRAAVLLPFFIRWLCASQKKTHNLPVDRICP